MTGDDEVRPSQRPRLVTANPVVRSAIETLLVRFEQSDYNPTPIVDLGVLMANADGTVDDEEREALGELFETLLGENLRGDIVGYLISASLDVFKAAGVESRIRLIAEILVDCDAVESGVIVALAVAYSKGGLSPSERNVVEAVARAAGLSDELLNALIESVGAQRRAS